MRTAVKIWAAIYNILQIVFVDEILFYFAWIWRTSKVRKRHVPYQREVDPHPAESTIYKQNVISIQHALKKNIYIFFSVFSPLVCEYRDKKEEKSWHFLILWTEGRGGPEFFLTPSLNLRKFKLQFFIPRFQSCQISNDSRVFYEIKYVHLSTKALAP